VIVRISCGQRQGRHRRMTRMVLFVSVLLASLGTACAPAISPSGSQPPAPGGPAQPARILVAAVKAEPKTVSPRALGQNAGVSLILSKRIFNSDLAILDNQSNPQPYLAEALPQLGTDTWKVAPDGTMETIYRLKPNLTWHDGTPLTPDDFIFSWKVYSTKEFGSAGTQPFSIMQDVVAPDDRTVVIHWTRPYPTAGSLQSLGPGYVGMPTLPRSILGPALESGSVDAMLNHPYWSTGFVGLGPYKLDRWEPGAFLEGSAFANHVLGAPKIARIKLEFITDTNAVVASMLNGEVQLAGDSALAVSQVPSLMGQFPEGAASVVWSAIQWRSAHFQNRPDFVSPKELQDLRVRKAIAHAVDRQGINEVLYNGHYPLADTIFSPTSDLGRAAEAAVTKYPFDLRQSAQLIGEAGFIKGSDGYYTSPARARFSPQVRVNAGTDNEAEMSALAAGWRQAGYDFQEFVLPAAQAQDVQSRSIFPGIYAIGTGIGDSIIDAMTSTNVPGPDNQWRGSAYDGYSSSEMDRLIAAYSTSLAPADRIKGAVDIVKLYSNDLPAISLFFPASPVVFSSVLTGPRLGPPEGNGYWDIYLWELR
ncbi:MAG TPA: ABC transporter substrate-binding protein, partial [Chloroflexota bacterium]